MSTSIFLTPEPRNRFQRNVVIWSLKYNYLLGEPSFCSYRIVVGLTLYNLQVRLHNFFENNFVLRKWARGELYLSVTLI